MTRYRTLKTTTVNGMNSEKLRKAVIFLAWGEKYICELSRCIQMSKDFFAGLDLILITDEATDVKWLKSVMTRVFRVNFRFGRGSWLLRKTELYDHIPKEYDTYLFLDTDTIVLGDISLGFKKANLHGIAVSQASHYCLDNFRNFAEVLEKESIENSGLLQFNTGVVFFSKSPKVELVFNKWQDLAIKHCQLWKDDQALFTLALETCSFNPYALSINYNYRGFGNYISGDVRIWHSHGPVPLGINTYNESWPPRRAWPTLVQHPKRTEKRFPRWIYSDQ